MQVVDISLQHSPTEAVPSPTSPALADDVPMDRDDEDRGVDWPRCHSFGRRSQLLLPLINTLKLHVMSFGRGV